MTPLQLQDYISQDPERGKLLLDAHYKHVDNWELIEVGIFLLKNNDLFLDFLTIGQPFNYTQ
jgi:hypothetical protein